MAKPKDITKHYSGNKALTLSHRALRAMCLEFFLLGFEESGFGFHGEVPDLAADKVVRRLVAQRFSILWAKRYVK